MGRFSCDILLFMAERYQPSWYHLRRNEQGLSIDVHKTVQPNAESFGQERISLLQTALRIPEAFIVPSERQEFFGFGPVLAQADNADPDWVTYTCQFPNIKTKSGSFDMDKLYAMTASLTMLFSYLREEPSDSTSEIPQCLAIEMANFRGTVKQAPMRVTVKPALSRWLEKNMDKKEQRSSEISRSMASSWAQLQGEPFRDGDEFFFRVEMRRPNWIGLDCLGGGTSLHPGASTGGQEYRLHTSNTDHPWQQLIFLSGIAELNGQAKDYYAKQGKYTHLATAMRSLLDK